MRAGCAGTSTWEVSHAPVPVGVTVNPATGRVFVANFASDSVSIIDTATLTLLTTLVGLQSPHFTGVADPATRRVFVAQRGANRVTVFHDETDESVADQIGGVSGAISGIAPAVNAHTDQQVAGIAPAVNAHTDAAVGPVASKLGPAGVGPAGVGFNTKAFCAEGSVRRDAQGVLQEYVTVFSETPQTVRIDYITNKGTFGHDQVLAAGVRYTDDANAFLTGPRGVLSGQTDVDTSVRVTSAQPVFLACPVYFNRSIGEAGPVSGGTVQDGSHN